jgi:hypothetical protein
VKKLLLLVGALLALGVVLMAQAQNAQPGSLGDRTAQNCQNGGLSLCDWCKYKESPSCPGPNGRPEHAEHTADKNASKFALPILVGACLMTFAFILNRGRKMVLA